MTTCWLTTDRQSTFCKSAIEPDQITHPGDQMRPENAPFALRWRCLRYTAFSSRSDCVVGVPCWSVCDARDPHGGTTEESNCSYLLPRAAAAGSKRHKYGSKIVPVVEIEWFFVYRMGETRSQLSANNGILVCLVREIWQFNVFVGKELTAPSATRGEGGYWRWGRRLLCLCWNWIALSFSKHWK